MLTVGSLFSGIGGFDLGLERAGMRVIWQSEIDPYASAVLRKHWPGVPNHGDVRGIRAGTVEPVDLLCGGFPCQPFSHAGKRAGAADDRHLWPQYRRIVEELRPAWVIGENVPGIIGMELDAVLSDLEGAGYATRTFVIPAVAVDAPHRRDRVWIIARDRDRESACAVNAEAQGLPGDMADTPSERCGQMEPPVGSGMRGEGAAIAIADSGIPGGWQRWLVEPDVGRVAHGIPNRVDRLRCLGNAIVPQIAEIIGRAIVSASE